MTMPTYEAGADVARALTAGAARAQSNETKIAELIAALKEIAHLASERDTLDDLDHIVRIARAALAKARE